MSSPCRKRILVAGAGGFIGGHLVRHFLRQGYDVRAVDKKPFSGWHQLFSEAENLVIDLSLAGACRSAVIEVDEIYNFAADTGGQGFLDSNRLKSMLNVLINTHLLQAAHEEGVDRYLFASSASVYNTDAQAELHSLREHDALPALPENGDGWEKLFSERMCHHYREDFGLETRVARLHSVYGPHSAFADSRAKAPAALCAKVIEELCGDATSIEVWGDGTQTRSFLFIDECVRGIDEIAHGDSAEPINLGSSETVTIDELVDVINELAGSDLEREYLPSEPTGVGGRTCDNAQFHLQFGWEPSTPLRRGISTTFFWILEEMVRTGSIAESALRLTDESSCSASNS